MFEESVILPPPKDKTWVLRLCMGNYVWLVKEKRFAVVCSAYVPGNKLQIPLFKGGITYLTQKRTIGRLAMKMYQHGNSWDEYWSMDADGRGYDILRLILPVEGHLLDEISPKIIMSNAESIHNNNNADGW